MYRSKLCTVFPHCESATVSAPLPSTCAETCDVHSAHATVRGVHEWRGECGHCVSRVSGKRSRECSGEYTALCELCAETSNGCIALILAPRPLPYSPRKWPGDMGPPMREKQPLRSHLPLPKEPSVSVWIAACSTVRVEGEGCCRGWSWGEDEGEDEGS
jgi:hypothetical protein